MCRIGINLTDTTPNGTTIVSAIGQYREVGSATWINFPIVLNNPQTPDLTTLGSYEVRVNVTNNVSDTSEWSNSATFQITSDCNPTPAPVTCDTWTLGKWAVVSNFGSISVTYLDCNGVTQTETTLVTTPVTFCAEQIISYDLGGDIPPENTPPQFVVDSTADFKGLKGYLDKTGVDDCGSVITGRCEAFDVRLDGQQSDGGILNYTDCDGVAQSMNITGQLAQGTIDFCSIGTPTVQGDLIVGGPYAECTNGTTGSLACDSYTAGGYDSGTVVYIDCNGDERSDYYDGIGSSGYDQISFCARSIVSYTGSQPNKDGTC